MMADAYVSDFGTFINPRPKVPWYAEGGPSLVQPANPAEQLKYARVMAAPFISEKFQKNKGIFVPPSVYMQIHVADMWADMMAAFDSFHAPMLGQWKNTLHSTPKSAPPSPLWENPQPLDAEITAYRAWDYDTMLLPDGTVDCILMSPHHEDVYWDGPVMTADKAPGADHRHGLYAIAKEERQKGAFAEYIESSEVWGRVALSGIVAEGESGYRAERVTIQELFIQPPDEDFKREDAREGLCKLLGDRYQCDVSVREPVWADIAA